MGAPRLPDQGELTGKLAHHALVVDESHAVHEDPWGAGIVFEAAVPEVVGIGGAEDELAPAVKDKDLEAVHAVGQLPFPQVVDVVAVGGKGVGHEDVGRAVEAYFERASDLTIVGVEKRDQVESFALGEHFQGIACELKGGQGGHDVGARDGAGDGLNVEQKGQARLGIYFIGDRHIKRRAPREGDGVVKGTAIGIGQRKEVQAGVEVWESVGRYGLSVEGVLKGRCALACRQDDDAALVVVAHRIDGDYVGQGHRRVGDGDGSSLGAVVLVGDGEGVGARG